MASHDALKTDEGAPAPVAKKPRAKKEKPALKAVDLSKPLDASLSPAPAPVGHNAQMEVPEVKALMVEDEAIELQIKQMRKAQGDIRSKAKTEFGIPKVTWQEEKKLRKLDRDVRIQRESAHHDLKGMLGYQVSLDLNPGTVARTEEEYVDPSVVAAKHSAKTH